jgi:hypothetical protein
MDACKIAASDLLRLVDTARQAPDADLGEILDIVRRTTDEPDGEHSGRRRQARDR